MFISRHLVNIRIYVNRNGVLAKRRFHMAHLFWLGAIQFLRTILYDQKDYVRLLAITQNNNNIKYILQYHRFIMAVVHVCSFITPLAYTTIPQNPNRSFTLAIASNV